MEADDARCVFADGAESGRAGLRLALPHRFAASRLSLRVMPRLAFAAVFALAAAATGCETTPALSAYEQGVLQARFDRDMALRDPSRSVLDPAVRRQFTGLRYFDVDTTLRFRVPLVREARAETVAVPLHLGGSDPYVRVGTVTMPMEGQPRRLAVYRPVSGPAVYWVPFRDATSGRATYGGGRYLYPDARGDTLEIDFNDAHNPNCDYNPTLYNCALPPSENRLAVPVRAGEKRSLLVETDTTGAGA